MIYKFEYTNGTEGIRYFPSYVDAQWFAQMEGDHLLEWYVI